MKYKGSCHCGKVQFEVELELKEAYSCNCSLCSKRGHLLAFATENDFKLLSGEDSLSDYQFNKKIIHHYFCSTCGVGAFGGGKPPGSEIAKRAINIRCLEGIDIESLPIKKFDGASL